MLDNFPRGTICIEDIEMGMMRYVRKVVTDDDIRKFAEVDCGPVSLQRNDCCRRQGWQTLHAGVKERMT